jgi:hypothetical protein
MKGVLAAMIAATLLVACTGATDSQPSPRPKDIIRQQEDGQVEIVTVYRGSNWDGVYGFRSECPPDTEEIMGGGAGKYSGKGYFNILQEQGHRFSRHGRVGWVEEIEVGPGPLEIHVTAYCMRR